MTKQDIREYTENELSLIVMNDEYLYNVLYAGYMNELKDVLDELYIYTDEQLEVLECDFIEEMEQKERDNS